MRVCFLNLDSINVTPYFSYYEKLLTEKCDYDLVYWDRGKEDQATRANRVFAYHHPVETKKKAVWLFQLATGYLGFRSFAKKVLKENDYDVVIALTGNVATLLYDVLTKKYPGRYIVDIRDYFLENIALYKHFETKVIDHSALTIISSPAFQSFLPPHDYSIMHNTHPISPDEKTKVRAYPRPSNPMVLASIGTGKNLELDKETISFFANDKRFSLRFIGRNYDELASYCSEKGITNVYVKGDFKSSETLDLYKDVDVIMSMYGSDKTHFKHQLTNKLYYALQLGLPLLVSEGSYMAEIVNKYDLGLVFSPESTSMKDAILGLYDMTKEHQRESGQKEFLEKIAVENTQTFEKVKAILATT